MRKIRTIILLASLVVFAVSYTGQARMPRVSAVSSSSKESRQVKYTGKVVDSDGKTIAGAKVKFYETVYDRTVSSFDVKLIKEMETKSDGAFSFSKDKPDEAIIRIIILAEKQGLAIGWANWDTQQEDKEFEIKLTEPKELAGIVVDENDVPVAGAEVSIFMLLAGEGENRRYIRAGAASGLFKTTTDVEGRFAFGNLPSDATAEFTVKKAGRAAVNTFNPEEHTGEKLQFEVGQSDIKLVQPVEAKIDGKVVKKGTDKSVSGVQLIVMQGRNRPVFGLEPVVVKDDGTFSIAGLAEGKWILQVVPPKDKVADWAAEQVEVTVETGKTVSDVKVEVSKGGLLEIVVTEAESKKPIEEATVTIQGKQNDQGFHASSDEKGLAKIRLMPGEYQILGVYKQGYLGKSEWENFIIEEAKTERIEVELPDSPKIAGVVRDKRGRAVADADIKFMPSGGEIVKSDEEGGYEVKWNPRNWGGQEDMVYYLVARLPERNLAAALEVDEDTRQKDIQLNDGVIFTGKVVDPNDKGIEGARIMVNLRVSSWGSNILDYQKRLTTDAEGKFEVKAIPAEQKYNLYANAEGYGKRQVEALADEAVNGRLDVGKLTLALANMSVTGVVVDTDGKPVENAKLYAHGDGQPDCHNLTSDKDGKFTIENVCAGRININAHVPGEPYMYGNVETEGGARDVKIMVAEQGSSRRFVPKQPASLVGKTLLLNSIGIDTSQAKDKKVLVCFFDYQQRPSRHCVRQLTKKAEQLQEKGVVVVAIQASKVERSKFDAWIAKYEIGFPVGMIEADEEKTRFTWGVKSLPWLIVADKEHIVKADGFSLSELDEKIKGIDGKK